MKKNLINLLIIFFFILSCSNDDSNDKLTEHNKRVIEYFSEIALGFEFGNSAEITRKWKTEMKIFVGGNKNAELSTELNAIISELNLLFKDGFSIKLVSDSVQSNFYLYLGSHINYGKLFPADKPYLNDNWGLFSIYWNGRSELYNGRMYVDLVRTNNETEQKHLLREELTQSLGLAKDSYRYPDSIFQQNWTTTNSYSQIDKDIIRLLYHPRMTIGLNKNQVESLLTDILLDEQ